MIVSLKKYLFYGVKETIDDFFAHAQNQGFVEFINPAGRRPLELPTPIQTLLAALKILRKLPVKKPYARGGSSDFAIETAERILSLKGEIDRLAQEMRIVEAEIVRVEPFGDFSMEDIEFIEEVGKRKVQFFCMRTAKRHQASFGDEVVYVNTAYDLDYYMTINREQTSYPGMIEMRIDRSVMQLRHQHSFIAESLHLLEAELKGLAGHIDFLHHVLVEMLNDYDLIEAKKEVQFPMESSIFSIEAWIPENKITSVFAMMDGLLIEAEEIAIEEQDRMPTYMENKGVNSMGEDLVLIYDTPSSKDKDPSGWVFWAFALFFAMIIADGGYGLLFLGLAIFLHFKFPQAKGFGKRFIKLIGALALSCIIWGIATASFFGVEVSPSSRMSKYSLTGWMAEKKADYHFAHKDDVYKYWVEKYPEAATAQTGEEFLNKAVEVKESKISYQAFDEFKDNVLLELALFVGVIHVTFSLLRYLRRHLAGIGWIAFMIGGYLYFPSILQCTSFLNYLGIISPEMATKIGKQLVYGGIGGSVIIALIQKRLKGISEVTVVIQVFADVLSYLRLYALALASSTMAITFNDLGTEIGLVVGIVIMLFGHTVNIVLSTMSGTIHGLRLNFIEWYHYSFEGGGKLFKPLKKIKPS